MITSDGSSERSLHSRAANCTVAATSARFVFVTMKRSAILSATGSHSGSRSPQARLALLNAGPTRMANIRSICSSRTIPRLTQRVPFLFGGVRPGFFEAAVDSLLVKPRVSADFLAGQLAFVIWVTVNQSLWETTKESPREEYSWSSPHPAINPSLMLTAVVLDIRLHVPWCGGKFCLQTHPLTASWK